MGKTGWGDPGGTRRICLCLSVSLLQGQPEEDPQRATYAQVHHSRFGTGGVANSSPLNREFLDRKDRHTGGDRQTSVLSGESFPLQAPTKCTPQHQVYTFPLTISTLGCCIWGSPGCDLCPAVKCDTEMGELYLLLPSQRSPDETNEISALASTSPGRPWPLPHSGPSEDIVSTLWTLTDDPASMDT
jgi:hypothetical protein